MVFRDSLAPIKPLAFVVGGSLAKRNALFLRATVSVVGELGGSCEFMRPTEVGEMRRGTAVLSVKIVGYIVLLAMLGAVIYASYIAVTYWGGIGV